MWGQHNFPVQLELHSGRRLLLGACSLGPSLSLHIQYTQLSAFTNSMFCEMLMCEVCAECCMSNIWAICVEEQVGVFCCWFLYDKQDFWVFVLLFKFLFLSALFRLDVWGLVKGVSSSPDCGCCQHATVHTSLKFRTIPQLPSHPGVWRPTILCCYLEFESNSGWVCR